MRCQVVVVVRHDGMPENRRPIDHRGAMISRVDASSWHYPSAILDDFRRYVIVWKPCTTMTPEDVTGTPEKTPVAFGPDRARVRH
jgi:hypothetical protein